MNWVDWLRFVIIRAQALTEEAFRPFGDVLETAGKTPQWINFGNTRKYANLAEIAIEDGHRGQLSIYRSSVITIPFRIRLVECHPLGSQAFFPLHERPFPVVVAPCGVIPCADNLRAFLSNGRQGVNFHPGVWHHYQLTLDQESDYIVVDRGGDGENYREHHLDEKVVLEL